MVTEAAECIVGACATSATDSIARLAEDNGLTVYGRPPRTYRPAAIPSHLLKKPGSSCGRSRLTSRRPAATERRAVPYTARIVALPLEAVHGWPSSRYPVGDEPRRVRRQVARHHDRPSAPPPRSTSSTCAGCSASPTPNEADPTGDVVRLREGRREGRRRRRLRRRLEARLLRLGVQGQAQGPEGRLPSSSRLPRRAREPAAPRRLRPRPHRGPHQLHRHSTPGLHAFTLDDLAADDPSEPLRILRAVFDRRPRSCGRGIEPRRDHRGGRRATSPSSPRALRARGHDPQRGRPLPRPAPVLPVRRGRRPPAQGRPLAPGRGDPTADPDVFATALRRAVRARWPTDGGLFGTERDRLVQRRPLRLAPTSSPLDRRRDRRRSSRSAGSTGR